MGIHWTPGPLGTGRSSVTAGGVLLAAGAVGLLIWGLRHPGKAGYGDEAEYDEDAYVLERSARPGDRSVANLTVGYSANGSVHQLRTGLSSDWRHKEKGDPMRVVYRRSNPVDAKVSEGMAPSTALKLLVLSLIAAALGLFMLFRAEDQTTLAARPELPEEDRSEKPPVV
ncbi:MAG: hypothetical protein QM765_07245 [Myxococcales bacterium]